MTSFYDAAYSSHGPHRRRSWQRRLRKAGMVCLVAGTLCILFSLILFGASFLRSRSGAVHRLHVLSLIYLVAGVVLLVARAAMEWIRDRSSAQRRARSGETVSPYYYPRQEIEPGDTPPDRAEAGRHRSSGMALVLVLVMLALISAIVVNVQATARAALRWERDAVLTARLHHAAAQAAWRALQRIADDEDLDVDSTNEPWAVSEEVTDPAGVTTRVWVSDENRRFDLNNLAVASTAMGSRTSADVTMDLMTLCGDFAPVERVEALTDWVDADDAGFSERLYYRALQPPYAPANRILYAWGELLWVRGFDRTYFAPHERRSALEPYRADFTECFTVLPIPPAATPRPINVNTASKDVLLGVLGLENESVVAALLAFRREAPVRDLSPYLAVVRDLAERIRPYVDVRSRFFAVEARAYAEGRSHRLRVLARRSADATVDVLQWVY